MTEDNEPSNLPAEISDAVEALPTAIVPSVIKALDRLLGAMVDIPTAWLAQKKAKIDAQTESYKLIEATIAHAAAEGVKADPEIAERAINVLVRKEYRKQVNRESVAKAMVEDMRENIAEFATTGSSVQTEQLDEDWLNVFEKYAEDASSERLQLLWGKVLAGEIRKPGRFSVRTLRFLSEFSQADALTFEEFAKCAFGDTAPKSVVQPPDRTDIRGLINLEAAGLIMGATGAGLTLSFTFNEQGLFLFHEGNLAILLKGEPGQKLTQTVLTLTPLGQELISLLAGREPRKAARVFANGIKSASIYEAYLLVKPEGADKSHMMEVLWLKDGPAVEGEAVMPVVTD